MQDIVGISGLAQHDARRLGAITCTSRSLAQGEMLYRAGDVYRSMYIVYSGSFKTVATQRDGREQVTSFRLAGEPVGLDGMFDGSYACSATALEPSVACVLPSALIEALCSEILPIRRYINQMLSNEMVRQSQLMTVLGSMSVEQRLATFLLDLSRRYRNTGHRADLLLLSMARSDIASYLGLRIETVSRMLARFCVLGLITADGRQIRILDRCALQGRAF
jgi:CRP/FNR family transcriptional regulator